MSRDVVRAVSESTRHGWSQLVGLVGGHVQEEACVRRLRARWREREHKGVSES